MLRAKAEWWRRLTQKYKYIIYISVRWTESRQRHTHMANIGNVYRQCRSDCAFKSSDWKAKNGRFCLAWPHSRDVQRTCSNTGNVLVGKSETKRQTLYKKIRQSVSSGSTTSIHTYARFHTDTRTGRQHRTCNHWLSHRPRCKYKYSLWRANTDCPLEVTVSRRHTHNIPGLCRRAERMLSVACADDWATVRALLTPQHFCRARALTQIEPSRDNQDVHDKHINDCSSVRLYWLWLDCSLQRLKQ